VRLQCTLCPHECVLGEYEVGLCRVRIHRDGKLFSLVYGKPCAVHLDPIEKKPLFHLLPGTKAYSIAAPGCNLSCKFCQNWEISQARPEETRSTELPPDQVVEQALRTGCRSIAYTYTEPTVFYEYMLDTARIARARGVANVWVTAGYINPEPLRELATVMDAANIDIKSFRDDYYRKICGARLQPVLDAVALAVKLGVLVELTYLVVPSLNDGMDEIGELCSWVKATLGPEVPLHFSRFFPMYRLEKMPPTPAATLERAHDVARTAGLHHVYTGNVGRGERATTFCPACGLDLVVRAGYTVLENRVRDGRCPACGRAIFGRWA
jgi:pyruvate formate lyase activating enzyme